MEYRQFGKTGLEVSAVGFGCWESSGEYGHFSDQEIINAVHRALDRGINLFDTAEAYGLGRSETLLGKALQSRRKEAVVVTKWGIYKEGGDWNSERWYRDSGPEAAMGSIERSLKFLQTDYVDVYLIHWPDRSRPFDESFEVMEKIRSQGKARFVGISNYRPIQIEQSLQSGTIDVVQYGYHMFDRRLERFVFPTVAEHGFGLMTYGSLAHGLLAGIFSHDTTFGEDDWRRGGKAFNLPLLGSDVFSRNLDAVEELKTIAKDYDRSLPQLALRWVLTNPLVSTALVGFRNPGEVDANLEGLDWQLDQGGLDRIDEVFRSHNIDPAPDLWIEPEE